MATREKLFRQKLATQIETLLTHSEKVFSAEKLDHEWLTKMIGETQELTSVLTIYQFLHGQPEETDLPLDFLALQDQENHKEPAPIASSDGEISKEMEEFETPIVEDMVIEEEVLHTTPMEEVPEEKAVPIQQESPIAAMDDAKNDSSIPEDLPVLEEPTIKTKELDAEILPDPELPTKKVKESEIILPKDIISASQKTITSEEDVVEINDAVALNATSLADKLRSKSIKKLAESIALNERFLYSNELFNGNMEAFKRALNELDHIASLDDATRYLEVQLMVENNWSKDSSTVQQFIQLVERRFN